jgi:hypothetical protein
MTRVKPEDNARTGKETCLIKTILSCNVRIRSEFNRQFKLFWSLIDSKKTFETSYFPGVGIITWMISVVKQVRLLTKVKGK